MSADNLTLEFHLTPEGWLPGVRNTLSPSQSKKQARPENAIASFELHIYQSSPFSAEERTWRETWRRIGVSDRRINTLIKKFGKPDEDTKFVK